MKKGDVLFMAAVVKHRCKSAKNQTSKGANNSNVGPRQPSLTQNGQLSRTTSNETKEQTDTKHSQFIDYSETDVKFF